MSPPILVYVPERDKAEIFANLIRERFPDAALTTASDGSAVAAAIGDAEILFGYGFPSTLIENAPALRWVHKASAGVEDVVYAPKRPPGLRLTRTDGGAIAPRMVEYVLGAIFYTTQDFGRAARQQRDRRWAPYLVDVARGKTVGVAGLGDIGGAVARRLALNGMRVVGWRRSPGAVDGIATVCAGRSELQSFMGACDVVVAVLPATRETDGLFDAATLAAMRPGSVFINIGRGNCVDEAALAAALQAGRPRAAVLDVFAIEPLPAESPLWGLENLLITPHVSGPLVPEDVVGGFLENLDLYLSGRPLLREVDPWADY